MAKEGPTGSPRFVTSTLTLAVASVTSLVFGMAGTMIVARRFSTDVYGEYTLILVVVSFLVQVSSFGLESAVARDIAGSKDEKYKEDLVATAALMRVAAILIASLLAWFTRPLLAQLFGDSLLPNLLVYVPVLFLLESFRYLLKSMLEGSFRFSGIGISDILASSVNFFMLLVVVYGIQGDIHWLLLTRVAAGVAACVFAFFAIPVRKKIAFKVSLLKDLFGFGLPLQVNAILSFIFMRIDTLMIGSMLGAANIAIYENARNIPDSLRNLYEPFRAVFFPSFSKKYAEGEKQQAAKLLSDSSRFVSFVTIVGAAIALLFGDMIIRLIFSEKYLASAPIFTLLMINLSIALTSNVLGISLVAVGEPDKPMIINFVHTAVSIVANLLLIPVYGLAGAAVAGILGTAAAYPPNVYFLQKKLPVNLMAFLKPLLIFSGWAVLVLYLHPVSIFARAGLLLLFLAVSFLFAVFTREDLALLWDASGIPSRLRLRRLPAEETEG